MSNLPDTTATELTAAVVTTASTQASETTPASTVNREEKAVDESALLQQIGADGEPEGIRRGRRDQGKRMNKRARMILEETAQAPRERQGEVKEAKDPQTLAQERYDRRAEIQQRIARRREHHGVPVPPSRESKSADAMDTKAEDVAATDSQDSVPPAQFPEEEMKKVKFALIVSYRGTGYKGLQINPDTDTIEAVLQDALYLAGMISDDNYGELQKIGWTRAARTDKGVHAAANVVAAKLLAHPAWSNSAIIDRINYYLPDHIRIQHIERVINSFDSKNQASSRSYEYIIPSFAFIPVTEYPEGVMEAMLRSVPRINPENLDNDLNFVSQSKVASSETTSIETKDVSSVASDSLLEIAASPSEESAVIQSSVQKPPRNAKRDDDDDEEGTAGESSDDVLRLPEFACSPLPDALRNYRMSPERRAEIDAVLKNYEGTKNHHNFTKRRAPTDGSCKRFITQVYTSGFFYLDDVEFVHIRIEGQSFMIHQIRKMIGFAVAQCRGVLPADLWNRVFTLERLRIPIAPALGLLLGRVHFKHYDHKLVELNAAAERLGKPEDHRRGFEEMYSEIEDAIIRFKEQFIYSEICTKELARQEAWSWLHWVNDDNFWGKPHKDGMVVKREKITTVENALAEERRRAETTARLGGSLTYAKPGEETVVICSTPLENSTVAKE